jgi:hypothetical protein
MRNLEEIINNGCSVVHGFLSEKATMIIVGVAFFWLLALFFNNHFWGVNVCLSKLINSVSLIIGRCKVA